MSPLLELENSFLAEQTRALFKIEFHSICELQDVLLCVNPLVLSYFLVTTKAPKNLYIFI